MLLSFRGAVMKQNEYDLVVYITTLAIAIAEQLSNDDLLLLASATTQLGETMETIALKRERNKGNTL